jgi:hypothetical protein
MGRLTVKVDGSLDNMVTHNVTVGEVFSDNSGLLQSARGEGGYVGGNFVWVKGCWVDGDLSCHLPLVCPLGICQSAR